MPFDIDKLNDRDLLMLLDGKNPSGTKWDDLVQRGPAPRPSPIPNYDPSQPVDAELLSDGDVVDRFDADPVEINAGKRNIDSGPMIHGRGSTNDPNLRRKDDVQIPSYSSKPQEDTTNYQFEPNRPSRWTDQEIASLDPENPSNPASKPKPHQNFHTEEIDKLLKDLETAQASDKAKNKGSRRAAWAQIGEEAATVGIGGLQPSATRVPMVPKHSDSADVKDRINEYDKLLTGEEKRQNPEEERDLKDRIKAMELKAALDRLEAQQKFKHTERTDQNEFVAEEHNKDRGVRVSEGDKNRAAGIGKTVLTIGSQADTQANRAAGEQAKNQAERQIVGRIDLAPHSATDKTQQAEIDGAWRGFEVTAKRMIDVMRKEGRNFPGSTAWSNLASDYMTLNQIQNHINRNGVMNFKDKDNNDVQIGNAQDFLRFVQNNGPDILEHNLKTQHIVIDQNAKAHGYGPLDDNWTPKTFQDYYHGAGGGKSSVITQDPNITPKMMDWINSGGKGAFPAMKDPSQTLQSPMEQQQPNKPGVGKIINGKFVVQ